jgi:uncharacterized Zn finger protein
MGYRYYGYFKRSRPLEVKGGIKAQSQRGSFGQSWWARRWIEVLEGLDDGARLSRGRSYARRGQVVSIDIDRGSVAAQVQGSRPRPYKVSIQVKTLTPEDWSRLAQTLATRAIFAARLLAGEMPDNVEDAFQEAGLSLFPGRRDDLETECSCPDWSNPCKHIAAVYYIVGEEFDRDPFLIFRLRGIEREELTGLVGSQPEAALLADIEEEPPPEPLPQQPHDFWGAATPEPDHHDDVYIPAVPAALPKRLGNFPLWRGRDRFLTVMENAYGAASAAGLSVFLGEPASPEPEPDKAVRRTRNGAGEGAPASAIPEPARKKRGRPRKAGST